MFCLCDKECVYFFWKIQILALKLNEPVMYLFCSNTKQRKKIWKSFLHVLQIISWFLTLPTDLSLLSKSICFSLSPKMTHSSTGCMSESGARHYSFVWYVVLHNNIWLVMKLLLIRLFKCSTWSSDAEPVCWHTRYLIWDCKTISKCTLLNFHSSFLGFFSVSDGLLMVSGQQHICM